MSAPPPPPSAAPPKTFPYDHLFKLLMIGDAGVGKVSFVTQQSVSQSVNQSVSFIRIWKLKLNDLKLKLNRYLKN
jgi:GTPase SAR1 family protein